MLTDIKHVLSSNPLLPSYAARLRQLHARRNAEDCNGSITLAALWRDRSAMNGGTQGFAFDQ